MDPIDLWTANTKPQDSSRYKFLLQAALHSRDLNSFCSIMLLPNGSCNFDVIYQTQKTVFHHVSKHREESWKYSAQWSIFDELRGVWQCSQTLSWVFDISSQSKLKLRRKWRNKIIKIYQWGQSQNCATGKYWLKVKKWLFSFLILWGIDNLQSEIIFLVCVKYFATAIQDLFVQAWGNWWHDILLVNFSRNNDQTIKVGTHEGTRTSPCN